MAKRIRARAMRRAGELLKMVQPAQGGDRGNQHRQRDAADPLPSRKSAAANAGFSERQLETATRIASIPEDDFEDMAKRIRARAMRRAGELVKQIDGQGARTDQLPDATDRKLTRSEAAAHAGFSERQTKTIIRIGNLPNAKRDATGPVSKMAVAAAGFSEH